MSNTPQNNSNNRDNADEPLNSGEFVFHRPNRNDGSTFTWLERNKKQEPYQENGNDADGESNKEPNTPARLRAHVLEGNDILG